MAKRKEGDPDQDIKLEEDNVDTTEREEDNTFDDAAEKFEDDK